MKISLALSGGAARGAFHLGVIEALVENGFEIGVISGSSIGAIVGVSYASGVSPKEQLEIFCSSELKKVIKFNYLRRSLLKIDIKNQFVEKIIPIKNIEDTKIKVYVTTIDLISGKVIRFEKGDAKTLCMASSALIPLFKPISYENWQLADGGIMDNLPTKPLKEHNLPIIGVDLHPKEIGFKNSFSGLIARTLYLSWRANTINHINDCNIYITNDKLTKYGLFKTTHLRDLYELGLQSAKKITPKDLNVTKSICT